MGYVELDGITKRFGVTNVVRGVSLSIERGSILALLGPSGSGKTTLLRLMAGFETPDAGRVLVDGEDVTSLRPAARRFGMVFQHYALFPHLTVFENVAFGLKSQHAPRNRIADRVAETLRLVDLAGFAKRQIAELSGGQQQRVALARALAPEPRVLLLDEPLSNLDPTLRERTRRELREALRRVQITAVFVTHEQEEAFELGDTVAVVHEGQIEQTGTPDELYTEPRSRFVATFVGRANLLEAVAVDAGADGAAVVAIGGARWEARLAGAVDRGGRVTLVARPERLRFTDAGDARGVPGEVVSRRYSGPFGYFIVRLAVGDEVEVLTDPHAVSVGDVVRIAPDGPVRGFP